MIKQLKKLLNIAQPVKYHWYSATMTYKGKRGSNVTIDTQVWFVDQVDCLNLRKAKKSLRPLHQIKEMQPYLDNGILEVKVIGYLGHLPSLNN